jgi:hemin uptake protein HemP
VVEQKHLPLMHLSLAGRSSKGKSIKVPNIKKLSSEQLFGDAREVLILHLGESYMLTITKQKKLLLTKVKHSFTI